MQGCLDDDVAPMLVQPRVLIRRSITPSAQLGVVHSAGLTGLPAAWSIPVGDGQVSSREERVARNESTTRQINEQIEQAHQAAPPEGHIRVLCECGREDCDRPIAMTLAEYESVRADPRQFAVTHNHVLADLERVVAETDRYSVVAKREGTPAAVAVEEDPRG